MPAKPSLDRQRRGLARAAIYQNVYRPQTPWVQETGFRTHALLYNNLVDNRTPRLAEEFLVNTRMVRVHRETEASVQGYFMDTGLVMLSMAGRADRAGLAEHPLPQGLPLRLELGQAIERRRSVRLFTGDALELPGLATILRHTAGVTALATVDLTDGSQTQLRFRATPSGGGLYPVDFYMAALKVDGLDRGIYQYDPLRDLLYATGDAIAADALLDSFAVQEDQISLSRAAAVFVLIGRPWRSMRKYGYRGMRFLFHEAGAMSEHIHLAATALGYGTVDCASVYDDEIHEAVGVDGLYETLLHTIVAGHPG